MRLYFLVFVKGVKTKVQKKVQKLLKKATYFSSDSKLWTRRSWTSSSSLIPAGDNLLLVPEKTIHHYLEAQNLKNISIAHTI